MATLNIDNCPVDAKIIVIFDAVEIISRCVTCMWYGNKAKSDQRTQKCYFTTVNEKWRNIIKKVETRMTPIFNWVMK